MEDKTNIKTVFEYSRENTDWYQKQKAEQRRFDDMISKASNITEIIDQKISEYFRKNK